ncbi:hypothetical protein WICPIJ_007626 [Wickerhamomyces pijperi]|uniref:F-box domain-containing protein n=1 Tax=Wickerhamomyces pijperi TaxID=599730 RepID=A0A9P8TJX3_WICPI|nr:hypothetical protein WICPIJ_007626 [Wickerhamomyces pijperi]
MTQGITEDLQRLPIQFPTEIIYKILEFQFYQILQNNTSSITFNYQYFLKSNLLVSKQFYECCVKLIYKYCSFKTPQTFDTFLNSIIKHPKHGELVKVLDFQEFTSIGLGRTGKMNKEIQMVTSTTILNCLQRTPNLSEFLASENIKDDLDVNLLSYLFQNEGFKNLTSLDFCGCSGENFVFNFAEAARLIDHPMPNVKNLSLHDCTDLLNDSIEILLKNLPNLTKLDLTHTQITAKSLNLIPHSANLTHLSLSYCIQLTTRELINFFINHPCITSNQLVWLNLQTDSSKNSVFNNNQLTFVLKMLDCDLYYLNLGGLKVTVENLMYIKKKFLNLKSLSIANNNIDIPDLIEFLTPPSLVPVEELISGSSTSMADLAATANTTNANEKEETEEETTTEAVFQKLEFLNISNNTFINRWSIDNSKFLKCSPYITAFEFSIKVINELQAIGGTIRVRNPDNTTDVWKIYDSLGRRGWLFKVDDEKNQDNVNKIGLTKYNIETGEKIFDILRLPDFLKYVNKKISLSKGVLLNSDPNFGDFERGIYKYYGMKM